MDKGNFENCNQLLLSILGHNLDDSSLYLEKFLLIQNLAGTTCDLEQTIKKIKFFGYELENIVSQEQNQRSKLECLCDYFFLTKCFTTIPSQQIASCQEIFIDQVLTKRRGHPLTIGLLFYSLAKHIGLDLTFVAIGRSVRLKYVENGQAQFLDMSKQGQVMEHQEILDLFNRHGEKRCDLVPEDLEPLSISKVLIAFLYRFEKVCQLNNKNKDLLVVYNMLLELNPSNLDTLCKRANLKYQLNMNRDALLDIKRYAYFCEKSELPVELKQIESELTSL